MDTLTIQIDASFGVSVACAAACKRFRSLGWTEEQQAQHEDRIATAVIEKIDRTLESLTRDLACLGAKDAGDEQYQASAWASFALAGIEIADSFHAERN